MPPCAGFFPFGWAGEWTSIRFVTNLVIFVAIVRRAFLYFILKVAWNVCREEPDGVDGWRSQVTSAGLFVVGLVSFSRSGRCRCKEIVVDAPCRT